MPHKKINFTKWDEIIASSPQAKIYATSTWLNVVSPGWQGLIYNDYEAVMPVTIKKKAGISYLAQPAFTQQLGVFSKQAEFKNIIEAALLFLQHKYSFAAIALNNHADIKNATTKANHIITLDEKYDVLSTKYKGTLIRKLKKAKQLPLKYTYSNDIDALITFYEKNKKDEFGVSKKDLMLLKKLCCSFATWFIKVVKDDKEWLSACLFFIYKKNIYKIFPITGITGRACNAHAFLVDNIIQEYAGSGYVLDFEGSSIPSIAKFNEQFGPAKEHYYAIKWNRLPWPIRLLKQ